ncbi:MAG: tetratricopeptide repeat protein [Clostridia bacterium]|nr:tetratricopeptide repeat protein [Clostridia bacterium]
MKKILYAIALFLALYVVNNEFGFLAALGLVAVMIGVICYMKRATLMTRSANQHYFVKGNVEKAKSLYEKAYKTGDMTPACKIAYSSFCLRENLFDKGRRILTEVINSKRSTNENKMNAKHNLAVLVWKEGNLDEAIELLEEVHEKFTATNTYGTLGVLYLERAKRDRDFEKELPFMLEAYDYNDSDKTIADNLGELYLHMGEYEKASEVYSTLLKTALITPMPYYNYGLVLKNMGDIEGARENFEKALDCRFTSVITVTREMIEEELSKLN